MWFRRSLHDKKYRRNIVLLPEMISNATFDFQIQGRANTFQLSLGNHSFAIWRK